ncbi:RNA-binding protein, putative [Plasmodium malariae]|uniref:RNA-binding protein, putative n=1 Tax=Plasmodium malariae TaxID=5858 RepID=A0A1C3K9N7_PLAMA|nr:RNA-binding protein, putative [Plasmodium malariae]
MQLFFTFLNTYAKEHSLNIDDYVNKENMQLHEMLNGKYDNQLDKKKLYYLLIAHLLINKENKKQNEILNERRNGIQNERRNGIHNETQNKIHNETQNKIQNKIRNGIQNEKLLEKSLEKTNDKEQENYNSISRLKQSEVGHMVHSGNTDIFCSNNLNSSFYERKGPCKNNILEQVNENYAEYNNEKIDRYLNDIYMYGDYMNKYSYDKSMFTNEMNNDDKNINK